MADISKITLPSGTTYDIKDAYARDAISAITGGDAIVFKGVSSTALTDGGNENPTVNSTVITSKNTGQLYFYQNTEFIYGDDDKWHALGDLSSLGDLAYKDSAAGSFQPHGTVSQPTFTGSSSNVTITATDNTSGNYQPKGSISGGAFTGSSTTFTGNFTPEGTVSTTTASTTNKTATVSTTSGTATYTPGGTVSQPSFTGTEASISSSGTFTPAGSVTLTKTNKTATVSSTTGTATYTPDGTVGTPTISVKTAGSTTTIKNPTSQTVAKTIATAAPGATAPSNAVTYYSVTGETLSLYQLGYTTGASITTSNVTVKTGDAVYQSSQPSFTGTGVRLVTGNISTADSASFSGTEGSISATASYTPSGTVSQPSFTGTGVRLITGNIAVPNTYTSTFTGTQGNVSTSGTPNGSNGSLTFTGTKVQLAGTTTAAGSVSQPTFTGTEETVTVS